MIINFKLNQLFIILFCLLLAACGQSQKQQSQKRVSERFADKVDMQSLYPDELYITSTGSGDTQEIAKNRAITGISQVIKVDVNSQQQLVQRYFETGTDKDMQLQVQSTFSRQVELTTQQTMKNINIGKTWFSSEEGRYYAFAYLDRHETAAIYLKDLEKIDSDITTYYEESQKAQTKLTRLAYLKKSLTLAAQRDIMSEQLNTISLGSQGFEPSVKPVELINARQELTRQIKIKLDLTYEKWDEFADAVRDVLASFGFQIVESDNDFLVTGSMTMEQLERKGSFVRWYVELHFSDVAGQAEFLTYSDGDREGHRTFAEAERRAASRLSATIKSNLYEKIDQYLGSLMGE